MPEIYGLDLQSALGRTRDPLPVMFLTDQVDTASTVRAMRAGAEDVFEKPTEKGVLLDAVRRALASRPAGARRAASAATPAETIQRHQPARARGA